MLQRIIDGRTGLIFEYLEGHPADSKDQQETPLIAWCAYHGDVSAIRYLLARGESLESLGENLGLNGAAFHGHWQLCQFLVERGADVNHSLPDTGETPLHLALCKANRPVYDHVVEILLANGADPNRATRPAVATSAPFTTKSSGMARCRSICWSRTSKRGRRRSRAPLRRA